MFVRKLFSSCEQIELRPSIPRCVRMVRRPGRDSRPSGLFLPFDWKTMASLSWPSRARAAQLAKIEYLSSSCLFARLRRRPSLRPLGHFGRRLSRQVAADLIYVTSSRFRPETQANSLISPSLALIAMREEGSLVSCAIAVSWARGWGQKAANLRPRIRRFSYNSAWGFNYRAQARARRANLNLLRASRWAQ